MTWDRVTAVGEHVAQRAELVDSGASAGVDDADVEARRIAGDRREVQGSQGCARIPGSDKS